jgi:hypothetical protein
MASKKSGAATRQRPSHIFTRGLSFATARADFTLIVVKQWLRRNTASPLITFSLAK